MAGVSSNGAVSEKTAQHSAMRLRPARTPHALSYAGSPGYRDPQPMQYARTWPRAWRCTRRALLALALNAAAPAQAAEPVLAGIASLFIPGLGQAANGDYGQAAAHFGVFGVSVYGMVSYGGKDDFLDKDERYDEANDREVINRTTLKYDYAARLVTDAMLYSSYAAYRDARARDNSGYRMAAPRESLTDLAAAPFSWSYLVRPTTFIPLAIQAVGVFGSRYDYRIDRAADVSKNDLYAFNFIANEMTAVGEEAMFRGFLNTELSERFGATEGLLMSSAIFGLAHTGQGNTANALQAGLAGLYLGWVHQRNGFEAAEGVALHYWVNVLAGIGAIRNGGSAQLLNLRFSF